MSDDHVQGHASEPPGELILPESAESEDWIFDITRLVGPIRRHRESGKSTIVVPWIYGLGHMAKIHLDRWKARGYADLAARILESEDAIPSFVPEIARAGREFLAELSCSIRIDDGTRNRASLPEFPQAVHQAVVYRLACRVIDAAANHGTAVLQQNLLLIIAVAAAEKAGGSGGPDLDGVDPADIDWVCDRINQIKALEDYFEACERDEYSRATDGLHWLSNLTFGLMERWGWNWSRPLSRDDYEAIAGEDARLVSVRADELRAIEEALAMMQSPRPAGSYPALGTDATALPADEQGTPPTGRARPRGKRSREKRSKEELRIAVVTAFHDRAPKNLSTSDRAIAREVGCSPSRVNDLLKLIRAAERDLPRGWKSGGGAVEAQR